MALIQGCKKGKKNPEGELEALVTGGACLQQLPESGHVLAPWVACKFEGAGSVITVSNHSSPNTNPKHVAAIKSFEYGFTDGMSVKFVIQDQQGGSFVTFIDHMLKEWSCLEKGNPMTVRMKFQFGWVKSGCQNPVPEARSQCHYALIDSVETSFSEGKFTTELTGHDTGWRMLEGGEEEIFGGEGEEAMCLKDAIVKMLTQGKYAPNVKQVDFLKTEGGMIKPAKFEYGCPNKTTGKENKKKGPPGKWVANGQNKIQVAMSWLSGWRSWPKLRSWTPQYDSTVPGGRIIFWEDRRPKCVCEGDKYWDQNCIGKFIVNGGKKSPVIEFNPQIRWDFGRLVSVGGAVSDQAAGPMPSESGGSTFGGSKTPGRKDCSSLTRAKQLGAGHTLQTTGTENHVNQFGKLSTQKAQEANEESFKALKVLHDEIRADLVIVGAPTLLPPFESRQRNVHIKFVNPFHLMGGEGCTDWLASPRLNEVLTNKGWLVDSVTHKIEAGNYTTTLSLYLTAPGKDGDVGQPLGLWCGAKWIPKFCSK